MINVWCLTLKLSALKFITLNGSFEESFARLTRRHAIMETRGNVTTHQAASFRTIGIVL